MPVTEQRQSAFLRAPGMPRTNTQRTTGTFHQPTGPCYFAFYDPRQCSELLYAVFILRSIQLLDHTGGAGMWFLHFTFSGADTKNVVASISVAGTSNKVGS